MAIVRHPIFIVFALALVAGCGVNRKVVLWEGKVSPSPITPGGSGETPSYFAGSFPTTDNANVTLDTLRDKPVVLVFASDTCDICLREAEAFRNALKNPNSSPKKVDLLTVMVGAKPQDVIQWKKENKIPWRVGWDGTLALYNSYCGGASVPCTLVQTPEKGIVYRHIGESQVEEVRKLTGDWE